MINTSTVRRIVSYLFTVIDFQMQNEFVFIQIPWKAEYKQNIFEKSTYIVIAKKEKQNKMK